VRLLLALSVWLITVANPASGQGAPFCQPGQAPTFQLGFAALKEHLGAAMGEPIECEHASPENGDVVQRTTTGLAYYRTRTNAASFTDGWAHWALTPRGLVAWEGEDADPPQRTQRSEGGARPDDERCQSVTVLASERGWAGDGVAPPPAGMEFVTADLRLDNGCDGPRESFRSDFALVTVHGAVLASFTGRQPELPPGQVPSGGSARGWVTFAVRIGVPVVGLRWDPIRGPVQILPL
jgi:hypothetical protein